jgi:hypothetical protein
MIKKTCAALLMILGSLAALGADIPLSAGGGALVGGHFTRYTLNAEGNIVVPVDVVSTQSMNRVSYGGYVFVDAAWAELSLAFQGGYNTWEERYTAKLKDGMVVADQPSKGTGMEGMLGITLLGKYPFTLTERLSIFPLAGLEYQITLWQFRDPEIGPLYSRTNPIWERNADGTAYSLSAWNSLFVDIGAGLDLELNARLFLRTELLYGFRLQTPYEVDALKKVKTMANAPNPKLGGLSSGPTLRVALGWRFGK